MTQTKGPITTAETMVVMIAAVFLLSTGMFNLFRWADNYEFFGLREACTVAMESYVEYGTRSVGPPPDGWEEGFVDICVQGEGDNSLFVITGEHLSFCAAWSLGQQTAMGDLPRVEPSECPFDRIPPGGGGAQPLKR